MLSLKKMMLVVSALSVWFLSSVALAWAPPTHHTRPPTNSSPPTSTSVPELDPTTAASALALLTAAALVVYGSRKRT